MNMQTFIERRKSERRATPTREGSMGDASEAAARVAAASNPLGGAAMTSSPQGYGETTPGPIDTQYDRWRADHLRELDEEYRLWRQGGSKNFPADFEAWRLARAQGGDDAGEADQFFERS